VSIEIGSATPSSAQPKPRRSRRAEPISKRVAKNGTTTYEFRIDTGRRADDARDRRRYTFRTLAEARREYRRLSAEIASGQFVGRVDFTVSEVCQQWLASRRDIRANTRRNYRDALKYVVRDLGAMKMQAVRQHHVDQWVSAMIDHGSRAGKPLAPGTVRLALIMLKQVTEYAARQGLVARDPAQYVEAPRQRAAKVAPTDVWTREQVHLFAVTAAGHRLYAVFLLACHGLRRSEVCGLRWADIDLAAGTLSVEQSYVEVDGREHAVDEPKTARSRRTLPLPADVTAALRELKTSQKRERLAVGVAFDESSHVCAHEDGTPVAPRTFTG
jgi:integrase